jgi:hypothetical protein
LPLAAQSDRRDVPGVATAFANNCEFGGVRNTSIPNYIYRFSAQEARKTLLCFEPRLKLEFQFQYYLQMPWDQLRMKKTRLAIVAVTVARPLLQLAQRIMPRIFANQIAVVVLKPEGTSGVHPWLVREGEEITLDKAWLGTRYQGSPVQK